MSKFINSLKRNLTDKRFAIIPRMTVTDKVDPLSTIEYCSAREYVYTATWTLKQLLRDIDSKEEAAEFAIRRLRDDVYGDLIRKVLNVEEALYARDVDEAMKAIKEVWREIYGY